MKNLYGILGCFRRFSAGKEFGRFQFRGEHLGYFYRFCRKKGYNPVIAFLRKSNVLSKLWKKEGEKRPITLGGWPNYINITTIKKIINIYISSTGGMFGLFAGRNYDL